MVRTAQINPAILAWARETAGLSVEEAAVKLGLKTTAKATAAQKLQEAESGERAVSQGMLEKASATYRRPLITFYLPQPPARGERGEDFRTAAGAVAASSRENALLDALVRDLRARQHVLREVLLEDEETRPLPFVASSRISEGPANVATKMREVLAISTADQRQAKDAAALFTLLRACAERAGAYVLLVGDLGSYHSDISEKVFRGVALADNVAPLVGINDNDAVPARSFTLMHELAHIWIGSSGVSGPLRGASENAIERFCNGVAGEFLLPAEAVDEYSASARRANFDSAMSLTDEIARLWNVSQATVTYRLLLNGWISDPLAGSMFHAFAERWQKQKQRERDTREPDIGGPSYYTLRRSRLGSGLLDTVRRALQSEVLTHTRAARILGVPPTAVDRLLLRGRQQAA